MSALDLESAVCRMKRAVALVALCDNYADRSEPEHAGLISEALDNAQRAAEDLWTAFYGEHAQKAGKPT